MLLVVVCVVFFFFFAVFFVVLVVLLLVRTEWDKMVPIIPGVRKAAGIDLFRMTWTGDSRIN